MTGTPALERDFFTCALAQVVRSRNRGHLWGGCYTSAGWQSRTSLQRGWLPLRRPQTFGATRHRLRTSSLCWVRLVGFCAENSVHKLATSFVQTGLPWLRYQQTGRAIASSLRTVE